MSASGSPTTVACSIRKVSKAWGIYHGHRAYLLNLNLRSLRTDAVALDGGAGDEPGCSSAACEAGCSSVDMGSEER